MSSSMVAESVSTKPLIAALVVAEEVEDSVVVDKVATRATRAVTSRAARVADTAASRAADTTVVVSFSLSNRHIQIANITRTNRILESQQYLRFVSSCLKC